MVPLEQQPNKSSYSFFTVHPQTVLYFSIYYATFSQACHCFNQPTPTLKHFPYLKSNLFYHHPWWQEANDATSESQHITSSVWEEAERK